MNIRDIIRDVLKEATSTSTGSRGSYIAPISFGISIKIGPGLPFCAI